MQKGTRVSNTVTDEVAASYAICSLNHCRWTLLPTGNMQIRKVRVSPDVDMSGAAPG